MIKHLNLQDGEKYLKQMLILGGEVLRTFDIEISERSSIIATINFLYWNWSDFRTQYFGPAHLALAYIVSDDDFSFKMQNEEEFFRFYEKHIILAGETIIKEVRDCFKGDHRSEDNWLEDASKYIDEIMYLGESLFCAFDLKRYDRAIILQTLSFLFENWKDMGEEEWNDPYILLEEIVNSTDFPKTEDERNKDTVFCEKHQEEIQAFGMALQEDLKRRGFFEPQESATAQFFRENPEANPFK